jgi:hypothetical protein
MEKSMILSEAVEKIRKVTGTTVPNHVLKNLVQSEAVVLKQINYESPRDMGDFVEEAHYSIIDWMSRLSPEDRALLPKSKKSVKNMIELLTTFRKEFILAKLIEHYHRLGGNWNEQPKGEGNTMRPDLEYDLGQTSDEELEAAGEILDNLLRQGETTRR